ncbi:MAG: hypothetical protein CMO26_21430 [Thiotrichales bacterium]|nr:hypothetical protein [Thiotrichales bacterium]
MSVAPPQNLLDLVGDERASLPQAFLARVARSGDTDFVTWENRRWSYIQALEEVRRVRGFLDQTRAGAPGDRVASFLSNQPAAIWTWFGTACGGGEFVALNRGHKGAVLADMIGRSRARLLVTEASAVDVLPPLEPLGVETLVFTDAVPAGAQRLASEVLGWDTVVAATPGEVREVEPHAVAGLLYTSGTTGRSKAVLLSHNQLVRSAARLAEAYCLGPSDVMHTWPPLFHVTGQTYMVLSSVVAGGAVALFPTFSRSRFWEQVRDTGATVTVGLGGIASMLLSVPEAPGDADNSLRLAVLGGIPVEHVEPFERRFGTKVREAFGSTEADPIATPDANSGAPPGSFGRPTADFEMCVADALDRPVPHGVLGQILVRPLVPDVMFRAYEDDDAATVAAWRNLWYHTGDMGVRDENGFYYFKGRDKFTIRRRGENVSVVEVEEILTAHPDVAECVAIGVPAAVGDEDVKVAVVPLPGASLDPAEVHSFCNGRMARFMVPRYIEVRDSLPYTELAKVKREELGGTGPGVWDADGAA